MVNCAYHPNLPAVATCMNCGRAICQNDLVVRNEGPYCMVCAGQPARPYPAPYPANSYPPNYYVPQYPFYKPNPPTSGAAIASLVTGILSTALGLCYGAGIAFAIAALITGIIARKQIKDHEPMNGSGMAVAGIVTGAVGLLFGILWILLFVFLGQTFSTYFNNALSQSGIIY